MSGAGAPALFFLVATTLFVVGCGVGEAPRGEERSGGDSVEVAGAVSAMLHASAASWNAGDLEGFLDDYTTDPTLTFVGGSGVTRGLEEVRRRYRRTYWAPDRTRDSLRFEDLGVRPLGSDHALATGRYVLYRPPPADTTTGTGRFTLVLRKESGGWKILHDHSSATDERGGE